MQRLNHDAKSFEDMINYMSTRATQLLCRGYSLIKPLETIRYPYEAVTGYFEKDGERFKSLYLGKGFRGSGNYKRWHQDTNPNTPVITIEECNIAGYLQFNGIAHVVEHGPFDTMPYYMIQQYYGDRRPRRAGVWLMNHIDEGCAILAALDAEPEAFDTFCLHPLVQSDDDLRANHLLVASNPELNWAGAFEYRNIANAYLSARDIESIDDIRLSPLKYVNQALVADKIQNYKDFMLYHYGVHHNSDRLFHYFHNWFDALQISTKFIVDSLSMLYDNDVMNAAYSGINTESVPTILMHTRIEREDRLNSGNTAGF